MIREQALQHLKALGARPGETAQFSWFVFRLTETDGELDIETLDFEGVASFTNDFQLVERIHSAQMQVLREEQVSPAFCNLRQVAACSKSYTPGSPLAFISRVAAAEGGQSGWYVGIVDDPLDVNDPDNVGVKSLYEISIKDRRLLPFWLLPAGYRVVFEGKTPKCSFSPEACIASDRGRRAGAWNLPTSRFSAGPGSCAGINSPPNSGQRRGTGRGVES